MQLLPGVAPIGKNRNLSIKKSLAIKSFYRLITPENGEKVSREIFSLNFGYPFASRGCLQFRLGNVLPKVRLFFSWYLLTTTANVNKPNRFCYHVQKFHGFRENIVSVNNSFHISYYVC